ncbi:MAG: hypothetical protein WCE62_02410 [Polyangiales bacterium]
MSGETKGRPKRRKARSVALLVLLAILALAYGLWDFGQEFYLSDLESRVEHDAYEALRPGGLVGHGYGIVGTALILANLLYLARRRLARWSLGSMATWLNAHVFTGLVGSLLILFHSAFQFRTPIALVTAVSLGVVVVTGIAGRYLYALTPRPDRAALQDALAALDELAPGCSARVYHALAIHKVTQVDTHRGLLGKLAAVPKWVRDARARGFIVSYVIEDGPVSGVLERKQRRRFREAKRAVRKYTTREVVAVGASSLLQSWRGFHRSLAVLLVLLVPIHIAVAWIYGYRWIFSE